MLSNRFLDSFSTINYTFIIIRIFVQAAALITFIDFNKRCVINKRFCNKLIIK